MADGIEIYEYKAEDVDDSIKELWLELAREMFETEHLVMPSEANGDRWVEFIREGLARGGNFMLVAKNGNKLVGFAEASILRDYPLEVSKLVGVIGNMYVLPNFRGKGIGRKLIIGCLNKMKVAGVKVVRTQVLKENKSAIKFYERFGFKTHRYGMIKQIP